MSGQSQAVKRALRTWDVYCQAKTRAQEFGASWASTKHGCSRQATEDVDGILMCWQHAKIARRDKLRATGDGQ